jgi:GAF domain-containing protein
VRLEPGPLSDKQIAVLKSFAAQAVIAIENARLLSELRRRTGDLAESLEQQTATSAVLRVISTSPGDLEPVFQAMLENAVKLCEARFGVLYRFQDNAFHPTVMVNAPKPYARFVEKRGPFLPQRGNALDRVRRTRKLVHSADEAASTNQTASARLAGARSQIIVPMLRNGGLVGAITVYRREVRPFSEKQIELLANFADQAVIAIENARLLNELRQRTGDLSESLEQQTAISDILRVISNSPGDVKPVFDTVAERAARICEAQFVDIVTTDGRTMRVEASLGELGRPANQDIPLDRGSVMGRSICDRIPVHVHDQQEKSDEYPLGRKFALQYGHRTILGVPLIREGRALGTILVRRTEVRPFEEGHIALLKTFADQAAIAIENARLLNELRQRTGDLTEALEQQTATSDVLKVISSSPGELAPVFQVLLENACRLCDAKFGTLFRYDGGLFHGVARHGTPKRLVEFQERRGPFKPEGTILGEVLETRAVVHCPDELAHPVPCRVQPQGLAVRVPSLACRCSRTASWSAPL